MSALELFKTGWPESSFNKVIGNILVFAALFIWLWQWIKNNSTKPLWQKISLVVIVCILSIAGITFALPSNKKQSSQAATNLALPTQKNQCSQPDMYGIEDAGDNGVINVDTYTSKGPAGIYLSTGHNNHANFGTINRDTQ